jgi:hypothetical protein
MLARAPSQGGPAKTTASRARTTRSARAMAILLLITSQTVPLTTWAQETSGAQGTSGQLRQCWMPEELRGTPEEKGIVQNVASAYRRPPAGRPQATPLPREWRGAIRRVDLPLGVMMRAAARGRGLRRSNHRFPAQDEDKGYLLCGWQMDCHSHEESTRSHRGPLV